MVEISQLFTVGTINILESDFQLLSCIIQLNQI